MSDRRIRKASASWAQPKRSAKPQRPRGVPHGRWLADLGKLSAAEERLVQCCAQGVPWEPVDWDDKPPSEATEDNTLRADVIRFLFLGGDADHAMHEESVMCRGAWISGTLNLHQCRAARSLFFLKCQFAETPVLVAANLPELVLSGSILPGLLADRIIVTGNIYLGDNFKAKGEVRVLGAAIGGDLDCSGGSFDNHNRALHAQGIQVSGSVFLRDAAFKGAIDLTAARIGTLIDDESCWQSGGHLLDGLHYDRIISPMGGRKRIAWLNTQRPDQLTNDDFAPQPWEQLTKVLREMGHTGEAAQVAMAKQDAMRKAGRVGGPWRQALHWIYGVMAGYGYRPLRLVNAMILLCLSCSLYYYFGAIYGYIGPTDPVLSSPDLAQQLIAQCGHAREVGKALWTDCPAMPPEYSVFQPLFYSIDVILPLVDLQQEVDWSPVVENAQGETLWFGALLRWLVWAEILFGWTASLMLVAILGRLVDKD